MSLFSVPGWSIPVAAPVREQTTQVSKKRKRPASETRNVDSATVNIEKLMSKLTNSLPEETRKGKEVAKTSKAMQDKPSTKKQKRKQTQEPAEHREEHKPVSLTRNSNYTPQNSANRPKEEELKPNVSLAKQNKKGKANQTVDPSASKPAPIPAKQVLSDAGLTTLQKTMRDKLDGARFRLINENLYKSDSQTAHQMMRDDPQVFEEYHTGFRHQVLSWPTNPVEHYISVFASYPPKTIIADLGCGDAALAKGLLPKGLSVLSFDLVSDNKYVVEADICSKVPLPGSEGPEKGKSSGEGQVVDVVVFALSLMGVNWLNSVREAWRILKPGGELHIAEVTSRFTEIERFQNLLGSIGFRLKTTDNSISSHFTLLELVKVPRLNKSDGEWAKLLSKGSVLKPCEYKRR